MRNKICHGTTWTYTNSGDDTVKGGTLVSLGSCLVGVVVSDIAADESGLAEVTGVFELPKATGAIASGAALYLVSNKLTSTKPSSNVMYAGRAFESAVSADTTVPVMINFASPHVTETVTEA